MTDTERDKLALHQLKNAQKLTMAMKNKTPELMIVMSSLTSGIIALQARAALDGGAVSLSATHQWECQWWRDDALENAALIAERYPTDGKNIAGDIRAMIRTQPQLDTRERDLALIGFCRELCQSYFVGNNEDALAAFQRSQGEK